MFNIRAIGGFSMMANAEMGIVDTSRIKSRDIDSLTEDSPPEILGEL